MRAGRRLIPLLVGLIAGGLLLAGRLVGPIPEGALHPRPSRVLTDRAGRPLRFYLAEGEQWFLPVRLDEVSPLLRRAVVGSEDQWYAWHPGVNPWSILAAAWDNWRAGRVVRGGSTLAMQVARLGDPRERTVAAKAVEALRALRLRLRHRPAEVLEDYLNLAPFGGNIRGVGAASYFYFGTGPGELSLGEAALLTALPRSPNAYDPVRHPKAARRARNRVLKQLAARGVFSTAEVREAMRQDLPAARRPAPFEAPHFSRYVARATPRGPERLRTTLDLSMQRRAEAIVDRYVARLRARGIDQAAVVVLENRNAAVRAWIGSADFQDEDHSGQVDGVVALRSPGSTLKPLLYALAIDRGLIAPGSRMFDVPTDFGGYVAENFDGTYRGLTTARQALIRSRNATAVRLLARVGLGTFLDFLSRAGIGSMTREPGTYGLPLILGAGETRLLDLVNAYAMLARGGIARRAVLAEGGEWDRPRRVISPEAAQQVTDILVDLTRPDLPEAWRSVRDMPRVAWKTGTSYGHRDAWSIGWTERLTIGVWVGNFDGRGRVGMSGAHDAAPLMFDLFRAFDPGGRPAPRSPGLALRRVEVCALSRHRPNRWCGDRVEIEVAPTALPLPRCRWHRRILVDPDSGLQVRPDCLGAGPPRPKIIVSPPPTLLAWWIEEGLAIERPPPLLASCRRIADDEAPRILSPDPHTPYILRRGVPASLQKIALRAHAPAETRRLYWYVDGIFAGTATPGSPLFVLPQAGRHRVTLVDDLGRTSTSWFTLEAL